MATKTKTKTPAAKLASGEKTTTKADSVFVSVAAEVENLTEKQAFAQVDQLVQDIESNSFRLGGILAVIQAKEWLGEHANFKSLLNERFNLHPRKALYLIKIYNNLVEKQIPWASVKGVGWTKLKEIAEIITQKNVDSWVKKAEKMTVLQLIEAVRSAKGGGSAGGDSAISTRTFKLHKDQREAVDAALTKGKDEFSTESDSVVIANICSGYVGGTVSAAPAKGAANIETMNAKQKTKLLTDLMKDAGWKEVLVIVDKLFDKEIDLSVTEK